MNIQQLSDGCCRSDGEAWGQRCAKVRRHEYGQAREQSKNLGLDRNSPAKGASRLPEVSASDWCVSRAEWRDDTLVSFALHTGRVAGSIPASPTRKSAKAAVVFPVWKPTLCRGGVMILN
jgi:hypothetical protein